MKSPWLWFREFFAKGGHVPFHIGLCFQIPFLERVGVMPIFAAMRIERHWCCVLFRFSVFPFGIATKKLRRGYPTSVGRAFALLMLRLSGFCSLPISLSRRIRDYYAIVERVDTKVGGLSPSLCLM